MFDDYYERKVARIMRSITEFETIYSEHLTELSGNHFWHCDSLTPTDRKLLNKLEEVGSGISELTHLKAIVDASSAVSDEYQDAMSRFEIELRKIEDDFLEESIESLRLAYYGYVHEAKELEAAGRRVQDVRLTELQEQIDEYKERYCEEYLEATEMQHKR